MYAPVGSGPSNYYQQPSLINSWWLHTPAGGAVGHGCDREGNSIVEGTGERSAVEEGQGVGPNGGIMDPQQQYCLKWNSFGNNLANTFASLFRSESLTDVTLFCEGTIFKAHKLILAACSKRFQEIFETSPSSSGGAMIVYLDRTSASDMEALLEFMYRGEVHVSQESLNTFLSAADNLQVKGLSMEQSKLAAQREQDEPNNNNSNNNNSSNNSDNGGSPPGGGGGSSGGGSSGGNGPSGGGGGNGPATGGGAGNHHHHHHHQQQPYTSSHHPNGHHHHHHQNNSSSSSSNNQSSAGVPNGHLHHNGSASTSGHSTSSSSPSGCCNDNNNEHAAESPENRHLKRRAPTPDPPSPAPATYPLSLYSTAHYYDSPQKRLMRSPNEIEGTSLGNRASVLRDNPAFRPDSAPHPLILENHLFQPFGLHADTPTHPQTAPHTPTELERELKREASEERERNAEHKDGVAEGKKLKCPHCERLYGYETNLRAHIRQRHQGIRVHCPFCSRTFTRNNTVRRHIAREHMRDGNANNSSNPSGPGRPSSGGGGPNGAADGIDKQ
ncbi:zinc finger protein chinmo [Copidosoma floridanum]|uniref:zinc finger protein chinmo n=1 Tax=Copidosoma floridanum TaxID=29053 RepID=UPI000C6FCAEA|nr:zinc finger protein chinmo [Copidosoma floridanum]